MISSGRAPGGWPFLGHVAALHRRLLEFLQSLPAHGDLVEIRLGPRPAFVICHLDLARRLAALRLETDSVLGGEIAG